MIPGGRSVGAGGLSWEFASGGWSVGWQVSRNKETGGKCDQGNLGFMVLGLLPCLSWLGTRFLTSIAMAFGLSSLLPLPHFVSHFCWFCCCSVFYSARAALLHIIIIPICLGTPTHLIYRGDLAAGKEKDCLTLHLCSRILTFLIVFGIRSVRVHSILSLSLDSIHSRPSCVIARVIVTFSYR